MRSPYKCRPAHGVSSRLRAWYRRSLGKSLFEEEREQLVRILANLFGYHLLQAGFHDNDEFISSSRIPHRMVLVSDTDGPQQTATLQGTARALPFAAESLDLVLLPHTLEYEEDVHAVIREVDRVLVPEGHLVIVGFNPFSLWGVWRRLIGWLGIIPWCGKFISHWRIGDWMSLMGFDVIEVHKFYYRPPVSQQKILQKLSFMETAGRRVWPFFGAVYILVARKRVTTITPIRPRWSLKKRLIAAGIAGPTTKGT